MTTFGPYRLEELLGHGGMGEVWRAVDTSHGDRHVAIKLLGNWLVNDPAYAERFRREAASAARLGSPHVVPIHRYGDIDNVLFLDMQLVNGSDLATILQREGPLPAARAGRIVEQAALGLSAAHRAGLVHRDVKPSNILITNVDGAEHVYIIDFGIAREVDATSTSQGILGTLAYMAPERFEHGGDHRVDIYALGAVLFETLTGRKSFPSTDSVVLLNNHINTPPPRPSALDSRIPQAFDAVVVKAMAKSPSARYRTMADFGRAIQAAVAIAATDPQSRDAQWPRSTGSPAVPAKSTGSTTQRRTLADYGPPPKTAVEGRQSAATRSTFPRRSISLAALIVVVTIVGLAAVAVIFGIDILPPPGNNGPTASSAAPADRKLPIAGVVASTITQLRGRATLVTGDADNTVRLWDLATGVQVGQPLLGHTGIVRAVVTAQLGDRTVVISGSQDKTIRIWDLTTGAQIGAPLVGHTAAVWALATAQINNRTAIISGSFDDSIRLWDLGTGAAIGRPLIGHKGYVEAVATTQIHGNTVVVSGSLDKTIREWNPSTGEAIGQPITGHTAPITSIAVTEIDGRPTIVSGASDATMRMWDAETSKPVGSPMTSTGPIRALTTTQGDSNPLGVSGSRTDTLQAWNLKTTNAVGHPITEQAAQPDNYLETVLATELDGREVVISSNKDTVSIWDLKAHTGS